MDLLAQAFLSNAVLASLLAVIVLAIDRLARRPALSHRLWLLLLLKLITPPLLPVPFDWPSASLSLQAAPGPIATPPADRAGSSAPSVAHDDSDELGMAAVYSRAAISIASMARITLWRALLEWRALIMGVWLAVSGLWIAWTLVRMVWLGRCFDRAPPAPSSVQGLAQDIASKLCLKRCPRVWFVPGRTSPALWVFGHRPRLLIPQDLWDRLAENQRVLLLAHELAHFRRGDHLVRGLELLVTSFYWWFPVVWCARRSLHEAEEQCCDAWVMSTLPGTARAYARTLLDAMDFLADDDRTLPLAGSGLGSIATLKVRLSRIMRGSCPGTISRAGAIGVLGMAGIVLPVTLHQQPPRGFHRGFHIIDLGPYRPTAINNSGQIVGNRWTPDMENRMRSRAYQWERGHWSELCNVVGMSSVALDINDLGQVTGWYGIRRAAPAVSGTTTFSRAFRTEPNRPINPQTDDLGTLGGDESIGTAINARGQVVGISTRSGTVDPPSDPIVGFRTGPNRPINPETDDICPPGVRLNHQGGLSINSPGEVVGKMVVGPNNTRSFRTAPNRPLDPVADDLGPAEKPGAEVRAHAINDHGQVVGRVSDPNGAPFLSHFAFCTAPHQHIDMSRNELRDVIHPRMINNEGHILGTSTTPLAGVPHAQWALHDGKTAYPLTNLIPPDSGWVIVFPFDMNDRDQIVGEGINPHKESCGFLLEPVPDPSPLYWLMAGTILTGLGWSVRAIGITQ